MVVLALRMHENSLLIISNFRAEKRGNGAWVFLRDGPLVCLLPPFGVDSRNPNESVGWDEWSFCRSAEREIESTFAAGSTPRQCFLCVVPPLMLFGVQERIFVVHGGLFPHDGVTLNHIRGMSRKREPPIHGNSFEDQVCVL